jgi:NADPH2:quinone reductase
VGQVDRFGGRPVLEQRAQARMIGRLRRVVERLAVVGIRPGLEQHARELGVVDDAGRAIERGHGAVLVGEGDVGVGAAREQLAGQIDRGEDREAHVQQRRPAERAPRRAGIAVPALAEHEPRPRVVRELGPLGELRLRTGAAAGCRSSHEGVDAHAPRAYDNGAMRAIVITKKGGPDVLELCDEPEPEPGDGELLVAVEAAGVNYRDVYEREGRGAAYGRAKVPLVAGVEGAGTVLRGAGEFSEGDRVGWVAAPKSYAERVAVPVDKAVPLPDGCASDLAAAVLLQGMTAHYLCHSTYAVQPGDDVIVHAAAGGVGLLLTQMAKARGARVIATTSSENKAALARSAGADETIGYERFSERARELTGGRGVSVVYDAIGATTFEAGIDALRPRGMMVLYGMAAGPAPALDPQRLQAGSLYVTRPGLPEYTATREELLERAGDVLSWVAEGSLDVHVGERYPLEEARRAHEDLEARRTTGKLLLIP